MAAGLSCEPRSTPPERIDRAGLIVPSGLGTGSMHRMLTEIVVPMMIYRLLPDPTRLERALQPIFTEPVAELDETLLNVIGTVFEEVKLERTFPKTATEEKLMGFTAPTFLAVAEDDLFFPPDTVVPRARGHSEP